MAEPETSRANVVWQRVGCAIFLLALAVVGFFLYLERLGLVVNVNQGWNALGSRVSFQLAPAGLRPGEKPALDSVLLADANAVGVPMGTPFVAIDSYHVHLRPKRDTTGLENAIVYVVRDARGARSSFAVPLKADRSGVWVDHLMLRQQRMIVPAEAALSPAAACVHAAEAAPGSCLLLRAEGGRAWECRCSSAGALVP